MNIEWNDQTKRSLTYMALVWLVWAIGMILWFVFDGQNTTSFVIVIVIASIVTSISSIYLLKN